MRVIERSGAAAASTIERLREVQRWLEALEVSPDSLWVCRGEELLAPLLAWGGTDALMRPFVEALETVSTPALDDEITPYRQPVFGLATGAERRAPVVFAARDEEQRLNRAITAAAARQRVAQILAEVNTPEPPRAASTVPIPARVESQGMVATEDAARRQHTAFTGDQRLLRAWHPGSGPERGEPQGAVTREDAARLLHAAFARDQRLLRAWHMVVAERPASPQVPSLLAEPEAPRMARMDTPITDPISARLQSVVDRTWRTSSGQIQVELSGSGMLPPVSASDDTIPLRAPDATAAWEATSRPFVEPPRTSPLRRLAAYGETTEVERGLALPTPSPAVPNEAAPHQVRVAFERANLAQEVAEIFRREAIRHGIVPEEDIS